MPSSAWFLVSVSSLEPDPDFGGALRGGSVFRPLSTERTTRTCASLSIGVLEICSVSSPSSGSVQGAGFPGFLCRRRHFGFVPDLPLKPLCVKASGLRKVF